MILNLQILRAFAALNVVLFHTIITAENYGFDTNLIANLEGWGANGVDLFFVISGFVMLYTQLENKRSVRGFLISRVIRIVPIYWILTITVIVLDLVFPLAFINKVVTTDWALASFGFVSAIWLGFGTSPIVYVGWTLELEMVFYLVFGASLWFRSWAIALTVAVVTLLATAFATSLFIISEFIAGLLIALLFKRFEIRTLGKTSLIVGGILLLISINSEIRALIDSRPILWGIPSALIVYGAVVTTQVNSSIGKLLGDASYSIYLIQVLSIPVFYKSLSSADLNVNSDITAVICLLATAVAGTIFYLTIEKPITRFLKRRVYG